MTLPNALPGNNSTAPYFICPDTSIPLFDCKYYRAACDCPNLQADNDIGGNGVRSVRNSTNKKVVWSFILTAGLTLIISIAALLANQIPEEKRTRLGDGFIDKRMRLFTQRVTRRELWTKTLERILLGLSDQQLVTGFAIAIAGLSRIPYSEGNLKMYHMVLVSDLVWLSHNTHLLTLVVLRRYFQDHKWSAAIRTFLMCCLAICLIIASIITGHVHTYDYYRCPVACMIQDWTPGGVPGKWMVVNIVLLFYGYIFAIMPLFDWSRRPYERIILWLEDIYSPRSDRSRTSKTVGWLVKVFVYDILMSAALEIVGMSGWFGAGVYWLLDDRNNGQKLLRQAGAEDENNWNGFGQIVPLFLLLLPTVMAVETYFGTFSPKFIAS